MADPEELEPFNPDSELGEIGKLIRLLRIGYHDHCSEGGGHARRGERGRGGRRGGPEPVQQGHQLSPAHPEGQDILTQ